MVLQFSRLFSPFLDSACWMTTATVFLVLQFWTGVMERRWFILMTVTKYLHTWISKTYTAPLSSLCQLFWLGDFLPQSPLCLRQSWPKLSLLAYQWHMGTSRMLAHQDPFAASPHGVMYAARAPGHYSEEPIAASEEGDRNLSKGRIR